MGVPFALGFQSFRSLWHPATATALKMRATVHGFKEPSWLPPKESGQVSVLQAFTPGCCLLDSYTFCGSFTLDSGHHIVLALRAYLLVPGTLSNQTLPRTPFPQGLVLCCSYSPCHGSQEVEPNGVSSRQDCLVAGFLILSPYSCYFLCLF